MSKLFGTVLRVHSRPASTATVTVHSNVILVNTIKTFFLKTRVGGGSSRLINEVVEVN